MGYACHWMSGGVEGACDVVEVDVCLSGVVGVGVNMSKCTSHLNYPIISVCFKLKDCISLCKIKY